LADNPGPWGGQSAGFGIYLISEIFGKSFRENALPGGRSAGLLRTVRYSLQNRTEQGAARWTGRTVRGLVVDSPRGPGGRSAGSWRTVLPAQQPVLPTVDFAILPLEFKRGQSARASRTVRKVRVLSITASNEKGEYIYSMPGVGEALLAL
jgi:hypothetical protein